MGFRGSCCSSSPSPGLPSMRQRGRRWCRRCSPFHLGAVLRLLSADPLFENGARLLPLRGPDPRRPAGEAAPGEAKPREESHHDGCSRTFSCSMGTGSARRSPARRWTCWKPPAPALPCPCALPSRQVGLPALAREGSTLPLADRRPARKPPTGSYWPRSIRPPIRRREEEVASTRREPCASASTCFANIRPRPHARGLPPAPAARISTGVIFRENTEGFLCRSQTWPVGSGEFMPTPDLALSVRKVSRGGLAAHRPRRLRPCRDASGGACHGGAQGQCASSSVTGCSSPAVAKWRRISADPL